MPSQASGGIGMTPRAFAAGRDAFGKLLTADELDLDEDEDADIQGEIPPSQVSFTPRLRLLVNLQHLIKALVAPCEPSSPPQSWRIFWRLISPRLTTRIIGCRSAKSGPAGSQRCRALPPPPLGTPYAGRRSNELMHKLTLMELFLFPSVLFFLSR